MGSRLQTRDTAWKRLPEANRADTLEELRKGLHTRGHSVATLAPDELAVAIVRLRPIAQHEFRGDTDRLVAQPFAQQLLTAFKRRYKYMEPSDLADSIGALVKATLCDKQLVKAVVGSITPAVDRLSDRSLANLMYTVAASFNFEEDGSKQEPQEEAGQQEGGTGTTQTFLSAACDVVARRAAAKRFNSQDITNALYACALMGYVHQDMANSVGQRAVHIMPNFIPQGLANFLWAWTKLELPADQQLFKAAASRAIELADRFNAADISNTMWAFAYANQPNQDLFDVLAAKAVTRIHTFGPPDVVQVAVACLWLRYKHQSLLNAIALQAASLTVSAPIATSTVFNTFSMLCPQYHPRMFQQLVRLAAEDVDTMDWQSRCTIARALATVASQGQPCFTDPSYFLFWEHLRQQLQLLEGSALEVLTEEDLWSLYIAQQVASALGAQHVFNLPPSIFSAAEAAHTSRGNEFRHGILGSQAFQQVVVALQQLANSGAPITALEQVILDASSGVLVDVALQYKGRRVALFVESEFAYTSNTIAGQREPVGAKLRRDWLMQHYGFTVVSIPFWEWLTDDEGFLQQRAQPYLLRKLEQALAGHGSGGNAVAGGPKRQKPSTQRTKGPGMATSEQRSIKQQQWQRGERRRGVAQGGSSSSSSSSGGGSSRNSSSNNSSLSKGKGKMMGQSYRPAADSS